MAIPPSKVVVVALILTLMFLMVVAGRLVHSGKGAIPAVVGSVDADASTKPPVFTVSSPNNGTSYKVNNLTLNFTVTVGDSSTALSRLFHEIYYIADWQPTKIQVIGPNLFNEGELAGNLSPPVSYTVVLAEVPEGEHSITIYAEEWGAYVCSSDASFLLMWEFGINSSSTVLFAVDLTPPTVSVLSPSNVTYAPSGMTLNFSVNEPTSWMGYSLDGKENITATGNMTLPELSVGQHMLRVYANDTAGNVGVSETVNFSIAEPETETFPTVSLAVVSGASAIALGVGLLVYFKKRKRGLSK